MPLSARFNNLRVVLLLQVVLPVFLLLGLLLIAALGVVGLFTEERLQRDLRLVARAIRLPVSQALEQNNPEQVITSLASVFEISEVYGAYLFDDQGERLVSFGSVNPSQRQADEALQLSAEGEFAQYENISGRNVYSFFLPLFDTTGQPNGLLQITRLRSDIEAELTQLQQRAWLGFSLVFLLMLVCLAFTHQRAIGTPLNRLLNSMQKVARGERQHRATLQGPREIQQLAAGLNLMLDAIHDAEESARKQLHEREQMAQKLQHAETMAVLGQLSAGVAHELGAPLSVVDGRAHRLLKKAPGEREKSELLAIRQQVSRMSSLVQQLLSFGRSSRARQAPLPVDSLFQHVQALSSEEGWQVDVQPGPPLTIRGDLLSLEQALVNLLRNARQACPQGEVRAGWYKDENGPHAIIYTEDAGPGIEDDMREQLFEPFVTSKIPGEGSGMGLAIVERVVRDHHGHVRIGQSKLGGARFELVLPLIREAS